MFRRLLNGLSSVAGAGSLSQFPSYYQQYLQRLSGRLDQAEIQVARLEAAAREQDMTLDQYVESYSRSVEPALRRQGDILLAEVADVERLRQAVQALSEAMPLERPLRFAQHMDYSVVRNTFSDFSLAVPLTGEGLVYAGIGLVLGLLVLAGLERLLRGALRRRRAA